MGYFKHGHIQCKFLESTGGEDQQFIFLIQESFPSRQNYVENTLFQRQVPRCSNVGN